MAKEEHGNLHKGHRERMKKRFLKNKGQDFSQHELLEMILYQSIPRADTNETAHMLINKYGSLYDLFKDGNYYEFQTVDGVGHQSAYWLSLLCSTFNKIHSHVPDTICLKSRKRCKDFFINQLEKETEEVLMAVCLSNDMHIVRREKISRGALDSVQIFFPQLARFVLQTSCRIVILAHNHPQGLAEPSIDDIVTTRKIRKLLATLDICLYDHIIVSNKNAYSMREKHDL